MLMSDKRWHIACSLSLNLNLFGRHLLANSIELALRTLRSLMRRIFEVRILLVKADSILGSKERRRGILEDVGIFDFLGSRLLCDQQDRLLTRFIEKESREFCAPSWSIFAICLRLIFELRSCTNSVSVIIQLMLVFKRNKSFSE